MADAVRIRIEGDTQDFEGKIKGVGTTAKDIFKGMLSSQLAMKGIETAINGVKALGEAAISMGQQVVDSYANYEQLVGGVDTLFKTSSAAVQQYAADAYMTAGLSANEYMQTVTGFSASLISSMHGDTAGAAEKANQAITDMSDNANKMGSDMASIQNAYQGFAKQNYTMLDNLKLGYGGTKEEMARLLEDASKISGVEYSMDSYADIIDAIHVIQTEMGITGTTAEEAEQTISGSIGMLKASVDNLITGFGQENADLDALFDNVYNSFNSVISNITPVLERLFDNLPDIAATVGELLSTALPTILSTATGLISQLGSALSTALPQIVPQIWGAVQTILGQIGEKLPSLLKGLISKIPEALGAAGDIIPKMIDFLTEGIGAAVEGVAANLPEILTGLAQVAIKLIPSIIDGIGNVVTGALNGLTISAKKLGILPKNVSDLIDDAIASVDKDEVIAISTAIETEYPEYDAEAYKQDLQEAIDTIRGVIDSIEGLDDVEKGELQAAIMLGDVQGVLQAAFDSFGVDTAKAEQAAKDITAAWEAISAAIFSLGLTDSQQAELSKLIESGATGEEITAFLESCGVDSGTASEAAQSITSEWQTIVDACGQLGLDNTQTGAILSAVASGKTSVVNAIKAFGLNPEDYQSVVDSYETCAGTLAGSMAGIFAEVAALLTDGIAENDKAAIEDAKKQISDVFDQYAEDIAQIYADKRQQIIDSGLTGDELTAAIDAVNTDEQNTLETLATLEQNAYDWLDAHTSSSTAAVQADLGILQGFLADAQEIDAQIKGIANDLISDAGISNMKAVKTGKITDRTQQTKAVKTAYSLYETATASALDKKEAAFKAAEEAFAKDGDVEAYQAALDEATATYEAELQAAKDQYDKNMAEITAGILLADNGEGAMSELGGLNGKMQSTEKIMSLMELYGTDAWSTISEALRFDQSVTEDMLSGLREQMSGLNLSEEMQNIIVESLSNGTPIDISAFMDSMNFSDADWSTLGEAMGWEGGVEEIKAKFAEIFDPNNLGLNGAEPITLAVSEMQGTISDELAKLNIDSTGLATVMSAAVELGCASATDTVNWGDVHSAIQAGLDSTKETPYTIPVVYEPVVEDKPTIDKNAGAPSSNPDLVIEQPVTYYIEPVATTEADMSETVTEIVPETVSTPVTYEVKATVTGADKAAKKFDISSDAKSYGTSAGQGFYNGLSSKKESIISLATSIATSVKTAIKKALQINSPSKVMAGIGMSVGEGLELGMAKSIDMAVRSANTILGVANLKPRMDLSGITTSVSNAVSDIGKAESNRAVVLNVNGKQLAQVTTTDYSGALNGYNKKVSLGYGRG